jgi:hypothetical protein
MKSFSINLTVESTEELVERLNEAVDHISQDVSRRFIDRMQVDDTATFGDTVDVQPVEMTRHE